MANYCICGLDVSSEFELTGAIASGSPTTKPDILIQRRAVPIALGGSSVTGPSWEFRNDRFLLRVPRLGRILVSAGRYINVQMEPGAHEHDAMGFVLGTAFGLLLHQRDTLVLRAAAVAKDGRAIAICGASAAGKSTLAAALCGSGYSFVTDDLCVVDLNERQQPITLSDGHNLKLWKESIDALALGGRRGPAVRDQFKKFYVEPPSLAIEGPRLSVIYVLREAGPSVKPCIDELTLLDALLAIDGASYHPGLRERMGRKPEFFMHTAAILRHAKVFFLARPRGFAYMTEVVSQLREHSGSLE